MGQTAFFLFEQYRGRKLGRNSRFGSASKRPKTRSCSRLGDGLPCRMSGAAAMVDDSIGVDPLRTGSCFISIKRAS
jgi:hypothetical protein